MSIVNKLPENVLAEFRAIMKSPAPDRDVAFGVHDEIMDVVLTDDAPFEAISPARRMLFASLMAEGNIFNGGFAQFFCNEEPETISAAVAFFEAYGPPGLADLLHRAVEVFPGGELPATKWEVLDLLCFDPDSPIAGAISDELERLDAAFYEEEFEDRLRWARLQCVQEHEEEFFDMPSG